MHGHNTLNFGIETPHIKGREMSPKAVKTQQPPNDTSVHPKKDSFMSMLEKSTANERLEKNETAQKDASRLERKSTIHNPIAPASVHSVDKNESLTYALQSEQFMNTQNKVSEQHTQQSSDEKNNEAHEGNFIVEKHEQNVTHFLPESALPEQLPMIHSESKNANAPITEPETNTISDAPKNTEQTPQRINDESYRETEKNAHAHEEKKIIAQKTEQRADAMLQSIQKNQTLNVQKINITVSTPAQHQNLLATPILISNTPHWSALENMAFDEINTEPTLFVETSDTQRQLFNQNNGADTGAGESFSEGAESGAQHISASTTDVTQKTLAIQHMMETIRTRIQDANIKNSMSSDINIEFTHPTLGAVDIQLKIRDNKVSTKFFGKTEEMRTLLRQNRNEIESILKDAGLELDQDPILIYQKEI